MTQDDMALKWGFSKSTINEYLYKLEEMKLLYTFRSNARRTDEPYHRVGNVYGRYKDKHLIIQEGKEYLSTIPYYRTKNYSIDRTSIKLRYNHFVNGSPKYDDIKEVKKLYKDCIKYNDSFKNCPNDDIDYLDLSVFEKYGFDIPVYKSKKSNRKKFDTDDNWGEPVSMEKDFTIEEILDMPVESDFVSELEKSNGSEDKSMDNGNVSMNPVKTITVKRKYKNRIKKYQ